MTEPARTSTESVPPIQSDLKIPTILGNGALIQFGENGGDVDKVFHFFSEQVHQSPNDGGARLDLALLYLIKLQFEKAYRVQSEALELQQIFRVVGTKGKAVAARRRILALVAPGDFMNNAQLEFLIDGSEIGLDVLYLIPGQPLPPALPEHDVLFCAVNESDANAPSLDRLAQLVPHWPRPVLNDPEKLKRLTREGMASLFSRSRTISASSARRVTLSELRSLAAGEILLPALLPDSRFPIIARPVGSHCGKNLEKIDTPQELMVFLDELHDEAEEFYLAEFIDYRGADGVYRKYRIVLIEGKPFLCHMAPSDQWKIHYVNVGMNENAAKREEEARAMETFEHDFALRHAAAFQELAESVGLDYFGIDCSETTDGRLVLFEAETAMVVHAMDSPTLYPYKPKQMAKVFAAFHALIDHASLRPKGLHRTTQPVDKTAA